MFNRSITLKTSIALGVATPQQQYQYAKLSVFKITVWFNIINILIYTLFTIYIIKTTNMLAALSIFILYALIMNCTLLPTVTEILATHIKKFKYAKSWWDN